MAGGQAVLAAIEKRGRLTMDDLLASVLEAYGGVDRWAHVQTITARLSIGGPF
jgi:hypothetical protein